MGKSRSIKDALVTLISGIEYQSEPAFTEVVGNPDTAFDGYPSVRVLPGKLATVKGSTGQNDKTPDYIVRTHIEVDNNDWQPAIDQAYDLTDLIVDTLDTADNQGTLNTIDPSLGLLKVNATGGEWFPQETQAGVVLMCDINVEVTYSRNL